MTLRGALQEARQLSEDLNAALAWIQSEPKGFAVRGGLMFNWLVAHSNVLRRLEPTLQRAARGEDVSEETLSAIQKSLATQRAVVRARLITSGMRFNGEPNTN